MGSEPTQDQETPLDIENLIDELAEEVVGELLGQVSTPDRPVQGPGRVPPGFEALAAPIQPTPPSAELPSISSVKISETTEASATGDTEPDDSQPRAVLRTMETHSSGRGKLVGAFVVLVAVVGGIVWFATNGGGSGSSPIGSPRYSVNIGLRSVAADGTDSALVHGGQLGTDARAELVITPSQPIHVYIFRLAGDRPTTVFPLDYLATKNPLGPGTAHRLPGQDRYGEAFVWAGDHDGGTEDLIIVTSSEPLSWVPDLAGSQPEALRAKLAEEVEATGTTWNEIARPLLRSDHDVESGLSVHRVRYETARRERRSRR